MALTLSVETGSGSTTSNSYTSVAVADEYHYARFDSASWQNATIETKEAALVWATRLLDEQVEWTGTKKDKDNALRWPRYGAFDREGWSIDTDAIPTEVQNATAELARHLIDGDRAAEDDTLGFKRIKVGEIELEVDRTDRKDIIPRSVISIIGPLGKVASNRSQFVSLSRA